VCDPRGFSPDKARRHVSGCSWHAPASPPNWGILEIWLVLRQSMCSSLPFYGASPERAKGRYSPAMDRGRAEVTLHGHRDATMIRLAYRHGLRASELCDLRWDHGCPSLLPLNDRLRLPSDALASAVLHLGAVLVLSLRLFAKRRLGSPTSGTLSLGFFPDLGSHC
jgi:hypothetical protein